MDPIVLEIRAPDHLWELIKKFWDDNKEKQTLENWGKSASGGIQWGGMRLFLNMPFSVGLALQGSGTPMSTM